MMAIIYIGIGIVVGLAIGFCVLAYALEGTRMH
jgi:hypothetical protein